MSLNANSNLPQLRQRTGAADQLRHRPPHHRHQHELRHPDPELTYGFDAADRITGITNGVEPNLSQTYGYDSLPRVIAAANPGGNAATYGYDAVGNRITRSDTVPASATTWAYAYPGSGNRLLQSVEGTLTRTYTTNAVGDITAFTGADGMMNTLTYDPFGRLASHTKAGATTTYTVNALDQRISKTGPAVVGTRYVYGGPNQLLAERTASGWTSYLWNGNEPVALVRNNQIDYILTDHLGRPDKVTNSARAIVWRANNFGFNRSVGLDAIGGLNLGFPGQYWDAESRLWHNGYRDYDYTTGRYLQSDPIGLDGGINTYAYVGGNPISGIDPFGLTECDIEAAYLAASKINNDLNFGEGMPVVDIPRTPPGSESNELGFAQRKDLNPSWDNKIHLSESFLDTLSKGYLTQLLNVTIHEALHFTRPIDTQNKAHDFDHDSIFPEAAERTGKTWNEFQKERKKCGCQ